MRVVQLTVVPDADGVLRFAIPAGAGEGRFEVAVVLTPVPAANGVHAPKGLGWPPGYFEKTAGSIPDLTFERGDQGEYEARETLG
ncbi:hypothetical protein J0H58_06930 [bacterium]|nr:hypothetical protein [bacterium]